MNPLSLRASGYRSFDELSLDLPEGCLAIIGENGAGKSSIVNLVDLCLFGPESRSLEGYLSDDGAEALEIELSFEHAGELYRVRRGYSAKGRGKTILDLEQCDMDPPWGPIVPGNWKPLTRESQKETQAAIEEILGLSRETFCSSAFLAQGDGAAFTEASPKDRKAILAQVLGLQVWDRLRDAVGADRRQTERALSELAGRISLLEETAGSKLELEEACSRLRLLVSEIEEEHAAREQALHDAAVAVQDAEKAEATYATRRSEVLAAQAALSGQQVVVDRAAAAKLEAVNVQAELDTLTTLLQFQQAMLDEQESRDLLLSIDGRIREHAARKEAHAGALFKRNDLLGRASALNEEAQALRDGAEHVLVHVGEARCDWCNQILGEEAAQATAKRLREQAETNDFTASELDREAAAVVIPELGEEPKRDIMLETRWQAAQARLARAQEEYRRRAQLEERLSGLHATIAEVTPELTDELAGLNEALADAEAALAEFPEPEPGAVDRLKATALVAKAGFEEVANRLADARGESIRMEARLEQAHKIAEDLADCQTRREALLGELDLLTTLERAYGRDGIPALIVEASAIPSIETEASRILAELGTSYRVELRTQRALKSGDGLADTLDVVVIGEAGERAYETFSGGERTRINLALRIALARLLAHRRGAESKLLAIDEPEFLDEAGTAQLAEVLRGLESEFERIVLVSHVPALRDAFDQTIEVEKVDGRSRIVGAREAVAA